MAERTDQQQFHPETLRWFAEQVGTPTEVQNLVWPELAAGHHVLATAPTGTGKTLAAFLVAIDRLLTGTWPGGGVRVLYLSPLKALNSDVRRNLLGPLDELRARFEERGLSPAPVKVLVRSGDTTEAERRQMRRKPPEILITTPESLNILLTQKSAPALFGGLRAVIVDEIHALADSKRGTSLLTALERMVPWSGEFQRVGLSATVNPPGLMAKYLGGFDRSGEARPVSTLVSRASKAYDLRVVLPEYLPEPDESGKVYWESLALELRKLTKTQNSTLIFANSRRACEKLARLINGNDEELLAYSHHGSLSKELRLEVEQKLKGGQLRALVATNSLELGIDIGDLDEVILAQTPRTAASAIQKVGRAGHKIGQVSRARLYPSHGLDLVEAAVISQCLREQLVEPLVVPEAPLDVLAQTLLSMLCCEPLSRDELFARVKGAWPYRNLNRLAFDLVLELLGGRYEATRLKDLKPRLAADPVTGLLSALPEVPFLLYGSGGTIPDRGYFTLREQGSGARLGELDEEFVWERQLGDRFAFGTQIWKIAAVTDSSVEVVPVREKSLNIPFWKGEDQNRSWFLAEKIGEFLQRTEGRLATGAKEALAAELRDSAGFSPEAAERTVQVLQAQRWATGRLPHRHLLVAELVNNAQAGISQVILHTFWGSRVNRPWAFALAQAWEEKTGAPLETWAGDDQVLVLVPPEATVDELLALVTPSNLESLLRKRLEATGFFGARFRESAGRALLLPKAGLGKRRPLWMTRLKAKNLLAAVQRFPDFPILLEAWRQCLHDEFDLPALCQLLDELATGTIARHVCRNTDPSPFTDGILWKQVNTHMYASDAPEGGGRANLDASVWDAVLASERPQLPPAVVADWVSRLQQTGAGYAPETAAEVLDLLEVRVAVPVSEWEALLSASGLDAANFEGSIVMKPATPDHPGRVNVPVWEPLLAEPTRWLTRWLESYGPVPLADVGSFWGLANEEVRRWADAAVLENQVVVGRLTSGATADEVCLATHWEALVRRLRRQRRQAVLTRPAAELPAFVAKWQGILGDHGTEGLQQRLSQLLALPLAAGLWEEAVFPSRVEPYWPAQLDTLLADSGLDWFGAAKQTVLFGFADDLPRLGLPPATPEDTAACLALFGDSTEKSFPGKAVTAQLWDLAWKGRISGTRFEVLRRGLATDFRDETSPNAANAGGAFAPSARGFQRWSRTRSAPTWTFWPEMATDTTDRLQLLEDGKARARLVLDRYGVVFRELLAFESAPFQWKALFPALKLLELSGEITGGRFFDGPLGLQFASAAALAELGNTSEEHPETLWVQHAQDPSSLCGRNVETGHAYPRRAAGTWLWWVGNRLVGSLSGNGRKLELVDGAAEFVPALIRRTAALFWATPGAKAFWSLEIINDVDAGLSPWARALKTAGFRDLPGGPHGNRLLLTKPH